MSFCDYDIGSNYKPGGIAVVGRDPGYEEVRAGRPFVGQSGRLLEKLLTEAGLRRRDLAILNCVRHQPPSNNFSRHPRQLVESELQALHAKLRELQPNIVVTLGAQAAHALVPGWPGADIFGAKDIEARRGYLWEGVGGLKVLTSIHPAAALRQWVPWTALLREDLAKAKANANDRHLRRPRREVEVVANVRDARAALSELRGYRRVASDIEIADTQRLLCIGFAGRADRAFVFTQAVFDECRELLESERVEKIFQNGIFDLYFLLTRCDLRVGGFKHDSLLLWHAAYPELAGRKLSGSGSKRTHKSLAFFGSLYTTDAWWKDYETDEEGMYVLNGRDCCVTYDVTVNHLEPLVEALGVREIYEHEVALVWPCVEMQARGMRVNEELRLQRLSALEARLAEDNERLQALVVPLIEERADGSKRLFEKQEGVCPCCRHASSKQLRCWSCAGFRKAPSKKDLVNAGGDPSKKKAELEEEMLNVCVVCSGEPRREWLEFNAASNPQKLLILNDLLKLPKRFNDGKPTVNEESMKGWLALT